MVPPQHLTTFLLDRKDGMITVDDGIRRLRLLDAKGKVWTQEMLLQVEEKAVSLIDLETKVSVALVSACNLHNVRYRDCTNTMSQALKMCDLVKFKTIYKARDSLPPDQNVL